MHTKAYLISILVCRLFADLMVLELLMLSCSSEILLGDPT